MTLRQLILRYKQKFAKAIKGGKATGNTVYATEELKRFKTDGAKWEATQAMANLINFYAKPPEPIAVMNAEAPTVGKPVEEFGAQGKKFSSTWRQMKKSAKLWANTLRSHIWKKGEH